MLLLVSLAMGPLQAQEQPQTRWQLLKSRLDRERKELTTCLKRHKDCDPFRKKIYITLAFIAAVLAGKGARWGYKRFTRVPEPTVEDVQGGPDVGLAEQRKRREREELAKKLENPEAKALEEAKEAYKLANEKAQKQISEQDLSPNELKSIFEEQSEAKKLYDQAQKEENDARKLELLKKAINVFRVSPAKEKEEKERESREQEERIKIAEQKKAIDVLSGQYKEMREKALQELSIRANAKKTAKIYGQMQSAERLYQNAEKLSDNKKKVDLLQQAVNALEIKE